MVEETFELPSKSGLPPEIVPQISQLANAYIENIGHKGKVGLKDIIQTKSLFLIITLGPNMCQR